MAVGGVQPSMSPTRSHECVAPGCHQVLAPHLLMCRPHWLQVPQPIRDQVNTEYRRNPRSIAHLRAIVDAIDSLQEQMQPGGPR